MPGYQAYIHTSQLLESVLEPVKVPLQLLQRIQHRAVRPQRIIFHDLLYRDKVAHVQRTRIRRPIVRRVEVDYRALPADGRHELVHPIAVGRLASSRWADDELSKRHGGLSQQHRTCAPRMIPVLITRFKMPCWRLLSSPCGELRNAGVLYILPGGVERQKMPPPSVLRSSSTMITNRSIGPCQLRRQSKTRCLLVRTTSLRTFQTGTNPVRSVHRRVPAFGRHLGHRILSIPRLNTARSSVLGQERVSV